MSKALLFVEDEVEMRELIVERIRDAGFLHDIYEATDPIQALDIFNEHKDRIGFMVCDFYLPVQNGNDLCQMIKEQSPRVQVICLTGDQSVKVEDNPGIDKVFYKPEGIEEMLKVVMK